MPSFLIFQTISLKNIESMRRMLENRCYILNWHIVVVGGGHPRMSYSKKKWGQKYCNDTFGSFGSRDWHTHIHTYIHKYINACINTYRHICIYRGGGGPTWKYWIHAVMPQLTVNDEIGQSWIFIHKFCWTKDLLSWHKCRQFWEICRNKVLKKRSNNQIWEKGVSL